MRDSVMFKYFLESRLLCIFPEEEKTRFKHSMIKHDNVLKKMLNKEQLKEYHNFKFEFERHLLAIRDKECFKMFYLGILLGMEVDNFRNKEDEQ